MIVRHQDEYQDVAMRTMQVQPNILDFGRMGEVEVEVKSRANVPGRASILVAEILE